MMPASEQRTSDRTSYYTMKTSGIPPTSSPHPNLPHSHSRSNSQSFFTNKQSNTPLSPPCPHSVGQPHPPKLSPGVHRALPQDARTPSPNYFGLSIEHTADPRDSALMPHENWSSPTSSVKSFAAAIPKHQPLDANPEFEAFRRQVDANRGKSVFSLSTGIFTPTGGPVYGPLASTPSALQRPRPTSRWHTHVSDASDSFLPRQAGVVGGRSRTSTRETGNDKGNTETESLHDSAYGSADSKRNSEASLNPPPFFLGLGRRESPASIEVPFPAPERGRLDISVSQVEERHPRLSLMQGRADPPSPDPTRQQQPRAETVPPKLDSSDPTMLSPSQLRDWLAKGSQSDILLLDVRVSPQFAQSRVIGALNLCIPTTLLKRATFNLQKIQSTFQTEKDQEKFANWRDTAHLVVYDAFSAEKRDAQSAMNMIKKFTNEGYSGSVNILRGGFDRFAAAFPDLIDRSRGDSSPTLSLGAGSGICQRPIIAPVVGGVLLPTAKANPTPFFNNIRQNQDLVDGVGQMDIQTPKGLDKNRLPLWLKLATDTGDHGKRVSDKFLRIELTEQSRMRDAYSISRPEHNGAVTPAEPKVQLSGIEQGVKNRYKDILPFEHARVKLMSHPEGSSDYINASHIQAHRSRKRYIASQGPLPATFEDFWSVIWDQDVRVIVMLTAESEGGQLKCHPYWKGRDFGPIKLRALSEKKVSLDLDKYRPDSSVDPNPSGQPNPSQAETGRRRANTTTTLDSGLPFAQSNSTAEAPHVVIRKFALSHASHPFSPIREITHLHYPSWPDFGAPAQPSHLLALVELANVMQRAALPLDVPGALASASASRYTSNSLPNDAPGSGQRSSSSTFTKGTDALPLSWYDAPEESEHARPMLVHCSAGCGRTGAFCTVDSVIDMLKRQRLATLQRANRKVDERARRRAQHALSDSRARAKRQALGRDRDGDVSMDLEVDPLTMIEDPALSASSSGDDSGCLAAHLSGRGNGSEEDGDIDTSWLGDETVDLIARTVEDFREQRLSMVQSLRQFVLCYEAILEWIKRIQERSGVDAKGRVRSGSLAM